MTFVINDTVGGTQIDVAITDAKGREIPLAGYGSKGATVIGDNPCQMHVPTGGPFQLRVRDHASQAPLAQSPAFYIGDIRAYLGQSNAEGMWTAVSDHSLVPNATTMMFGPNGGWHAPKGDGLITFLNELHRLTNVPQAVIAGGLGATPLTFDAYFQYVGMLGIEQNPPWLDASNKVWTGFTTMLAGAGGRIAGVIWDQGESDTYNVASKTYTDGLHVLWGRIQSLVTDRRPPALRFAMVRLGHYAPSPASAVPTGTDTGPIIRAQADFASREPGAYIATHREDLERDSGDVHLSAAGYAALGRRLAAGIYVNEYGGEPPRVQ